MDNKTWHVVKILGDESLIDCKWVYKLKDNSVDDETRIFKAKLMARGFARKKYLTYNKVFLECNKIW